MTSCTGSVRRWFWRLEKKSELGPAVRRIRVTFTCSQWPCCGCHTCCMVGGDGKASIERLCISLPYVETFNSKVIKGFVPELRSRYVFFVFRDSYVLFIYVMNILCTFHISASWVWYSHYSLALFDSKWKYLLGSVWFGLVLWHINYCCFFNFKSCFCIYIKYTICKNIL